MYLPDFTEQLFSTARREAIPRNGQKLYKRSLNPCPREFLVQWMPVPPIRVRLTPLWPLRNLLTMEDWWYWGRWLLKCCGCCWCVYLWYLRHTYSCTSGPQVPLKVLYESVPCINEYVWHNRYHVHSRHVEKHHHGQWVWNGLYYGEESQGVNCLISYLSLYNGGGSVLVIGSYNWGQKLSAWVHVWVPCVCFQRVGKFDLRNFQHCQDHSRGLWCSFLPVACQSKKIHVIGVLFIRLVPLRSPVPVTRWGNCIFLISYWYVQHFLWCCYYYDIDRVDSTQKCFLIC